MKRSPSPNVQQNKVDEIMSRVRGARREMMRSVFEHPRDYVLLNIREFGQKLRVDPATISRTVTAMGFSGYREFQKYTQRALNACVLQIPGRPHLTAACARLFAGLSIIWNQFATV
jgi:DNA-binding MurR/RpiR family transcriptional regulator